MTFLSGFKRGNVKKASAARAAAGHVGALSRITYSIQKKCSQLDTVGCFVKWSILSL